MLLTSVYGVLNGFWILFFSFVMVKKAVNILYKIPRWVLTVFMVALVSFLTLDSDPLPSVNISLFPGADKVVHGLMFFAIGFSLHFDVSRTGKRKFFITLVNIFAVTAFGGIIEILQGAMDVGRSADFMDFIADFVGVVFGIATAIWYLSISNYGRG